MDPVPAPTADGRSRRWEGHRARRRAAFVDAAVAVIDEVGPSASVEQIASAAGVTRQVLYRQFSGRADLDEAIVSRAASLVYDNVIADIDQLDDVGTAIRRVLDGYLDFIDAHRSLYWFTRTRQANLVESDPIDQVKGRLAAVAVAIAHELRDERGTEPTIPLDEVFAVGMVGMVDAAVSRWLLQPGATTRAQLVDGLVLVLVAAIDAAIPPA